MATEVIKLGEIAARRREYEVYAQASDSAKGVLEAEYAASRKSLTPPIALALRIACGEIVDEQLIKDFIFRSGQVPTPEANPFVVEISRYDHRVRMAVSSGLLAFHRHFIRRERVNPTVGKFRSVSDIELLNIGGLGIDRIAFLRFLFEKQGIELEDPFKGIPSRVIPKEVIPGMRYFLPSEIAELECVQYTPQRIQQLLAQGAIEGFRLADRWVLTELGLQQILNRQEYYDRSKGGAKPGQKLKS